METKEEEENSLDKEEEEEGEVERTQEPFKIEEEILQPATNEPEDEINDSLQDSTEEDFQQYSEGSTNGDEEEDRNVPNENNDSAERINKSMEVVKDKIEDEDDTEKETDDLTDYETEIKEEIDANPEPHKPIIMGRRKTVDYSPSFCPSVKLLGKRQSIDPVRIKARGVSNVPDITKKSTEYVPSEVRIPKISGGEGGIRDKSMRPPSRKEISNPILPPEQPRPFVTTPNPGRARALMEAPNLARLMSSKESPANRPDSAQSNSTTTTTTSCTLSLSEADSGVSDLSNGSRRSSGIH